MEPCVWGQTLEFDEIDRYKVSTTSKQKKSSTKSRITLKKIQNKKDRNFFLLFSLIFCPPVNGGAYEIKNILSGKLNDQEW